MDPAKSLSRHVFVDESGDPSLEVDREGVSEYFVLTAIILDSSDVEVEEEKARRIAAKYFPKGEIKSSKIGGNQSRRSQIIREVAKLRFRHFSQVIDKSRILEDSGLRFRRSFVKFINRILYKNLFQSFSDLQVIADEHGRSDFMEGFPSYLERRLPQRLFETWTFDFANSGSQPLLQIADLIAGSISRCYAGLDPMTILEPIRSHTLIIDEWPPRFPEPMGLDELGELEKHNFIVRHVALEKAEQFIDSRSLSEDRDEMAQVAAARYLLYHFRSIDPEEYIPTAVLHEHLENLGFTMSVRVLRASVIGRLRDESVFIASTRKGIKIPYSASDLIDFVSTVNTQVVPYLKRLEICRKQFLIATNGSLDVVTQKQFPDLARYLSGDA
jgi:hypothetical protein